jgi:hypothetical protein
MNTDPLADIPSDTSPTDAPETFDDAVAVVAVEIAETLIRKRRDYGTRGVGDFPLGSDVFLAAQVWNKTTRILNLLDDRTPSNEPLADSWRDLAGYAMLALIHSRGWFALPSKERDPSLRLGRADG